MIPIQLKQAIDRYVNHGIPTGDFLRAVLENNLMEAIGRADDDNIKIIHNICRYVYNEIPMICHGNIEKVQKWIEKGGLNGN